MGRYTKKKKDKNRLNFFLLILAIVLLILIIIQAVMLKTYEKAVYGQNVKTSAYSLEVT